MYYKLGLAKRILKNLGQYELNTPDEDIWEFGAEKVVGGAITDPYVLAKRYDEKTLDMLDDIVANMRKTTRMTFKTQVSCNFGIGDYDTPSFNSDIYIQRRIKDWCVQDIKNEIYDLTLRDCAIRNDFSNFAKDLGVGYISFKEMNDLFMDNDRYIQFLKQISALENTKDEILKTLNAFQDITVWLDGKEHIIPVCDIINKQSDFWKRGGIQKYEVGYEDERNVEDELLNGDFEYYYYTEVDSEIDLSEKESELTSECLDIYDEMTL